MPVTRMKNLSTLSCSLFDINAINEKIRFWKMAWYNSIVIM